MDDKPKRKDLTHVGFDANAKNESFGTDIGKRGDLGRIAKINYQVKC
jgi:hypothetical protein